MNFNKEQFDRIAQQYDTTRRCFLPCYDDFYGTAVSLLKQFRNDFKRVADLGAGTGLLTQSLYELYPKADYTLIDLSNEMLDVARQRFAGLPNFTYIEGNYTDHIPPSCDLICSALSIHHLEDDDKRRAYQNIATSLDRGGCLLTLDQFNASSVMVNDLYVRWWTDYIDRSGLPPEQRDAWLERKRRLDHENTVPLTLEILHDSGFNTAECIYSFMKFSVILAIK